jgi:hypothetical protein
MRGKGIGFYSGLLLLLLVLTTACDTPIALSISEAKRRALIEIGTLKDTTQIGVVQVMQDSSNHWLAAYNEAQTTPSVFLFRVENAQEHSHAFRMRHKQDAKISKILFEDITYDGELEMLVYLHFDYDLSYQGRELIIYKKPFDTIDNKEVFTFPLEQSWEHIESFDSVYGVPEHRKRVENHVTAEFFEGKILIKGTINGKKHHMLEYEWDDFSESFKKILDEDLHEEGDESLNKGVVAKVKGSKILLEVSAHEPGCRAFILEDVKGQVLQLEEDLKEALHCSPVTSLSEDGRFLVYMNKDKDELQLYDFEKDERITLLKKLEAMEGISDIVWYQQKGRNDLAFVAVNMDEFEANSRIYLWRFRNKEWKSKYYDRMVYFECDFDGICAPQQTYDYRFSKSGNFLYRQDNKGHSKEDFVVLKLE